MPQIRRPQSQTKIKVVPRDGELEITLNINISLDGKVTATADNAEVSAMGLEEEDDDAAPMVPDFASGIKLNFGKEE